MIVAAGVGRAELVTGLLVVAALAAAVMIFDPKHRRRGVAFYAAWVVPGLGHVVLSRWKKGLVLFGLLGGVFLAGLALCGWRTVAFEDNPFYYVGQFGSGMTFLAGQLLGTPKAHPVDHLPPSWIDPGMLYVCVTGLLNVVVMMGVFDARIPVEAAPVAAAPAPEPAPAAEVKP